MAEQQPQPQVPQVQKKSLKDQGNDLWDKIQLALVIALLAIFVIIIFQNWEDVRVDGLFWNFNAPLSLVMLVSFLLGFLVCALLWAKRRYFTED